VPHEIVVVALGESNAFDLAIPGQVFGSVAVDGQDAYRVRVCSIDGSPVTTSAGYSVIVQYDLSIVAQADTVIIAPGIDARLSAPGIDDRLRAALLAANDRGARMVSICTGAFVLASAGLLDGRRATTYWKRSAEFRALFPRVILEPDVLYVDDGVLSSAGVAAGIDLCLYIVRSDHGMAVANEASRSLVVAPTRSGGQAQFIERERLDDDGERLARVLAWASENVTKPVDVATLARRAMMSERTFNRRFRERTGTSPAAWITAERLLVARELLETTDLLVDEIARASGLGSATHLRSQFQRRFGQTPTEYRRVYRPVQIG